MIPQKFNIFNWASEKSVELVMIELGYQHNVIIEGDMIEIARKFFDAGVNVKLIHNDGKKNSIDILYLDNKGFHTR